MRGVRWSGRAFTWFELLVIVVLVGAMLALLQLPEQTSPPSQGGPGAVPTQASGSACHTVP